jgi:hypothetical protein
MPQPAFELTFDFGVDDLVRFNQAVMSNDPRYQSSRRVVPLMGVASLVAVVMLRAWSYAPAVVALALMAVLLSPWGTALMARLYLGRALRKGARVGELGAWRVTLDDEGLAAAAAGTRSEVAWSGIVAVLEKPEAIYLMTTARTGYALPRRALSDGDAVAAFALARIRAAHGGRLPANRPAYRSTIGLWAFLLALLWLLYSVFTRRAG